MKENTGKSKYVILGMLARMPQTGYTIKKWIENEYSHFWQESYGQIYPTLKKMVAEGLAVTSNNRQSGNGRGQIVYNSLTQAEKSSQIGLERSRKSRESGTNYCLKFPLARTRSRRCCLVIWTILSEGMISW